MKKKLVTIIITFAVLCCVVPLFSQEEGENTEEGQNDELNIGFIFNTNSILLEVESYQAGIGMKFGDDNLSVRGLLDIYYIHSASLFTIDLGAAIEYHFITGIISPYFGGFIKVGFTSIYSEIDADNWTHNYSIPISAGPLLGVEIFPFPFLSIFAEYNIEARFSIGIDQVNSSGTVTQTNNFDFLIDSKIGNNSKLGIVVYFSKIGGIDPIDTDE
jgi:hypothetical protein